LLVLRQSKKAGKYLKVSIRYFPFFNQKTKRERALRNIKLLLEYDGSRYDGWMPSKTKKGGMSISEKVQEVLRRMTGEEIVLDAAVRTEAGVHAYGQVANFKTACPQKLYEIKHYLNRYLPGDIAVLEVSEVPERFHSTLSAQKIHYEYRIGTGEIESVFERKYRYYSFKKLDVGAMRQAAALLVGRHDFRAFSENRKMKKSTEREFYQIELYADIEEISITMVADDFWPGLARIIAGTLLEVGRGERTLETVAGALEAGGREMAGAMAEARGLFLSEVEYA
jgi:tRNA pseudouridine38-40 synthase